tara:strand:- start:360 stop:533 length:174 start_codon:yes stop_codon:yes gene_type:complete
MITDRKVFQAFNFKSATKQSEENIYVPIKRTVLPKVRLSFNDTMNHLRKELILIKKR